MSTPFPQKWRISISPPKGMQTIEARKAEDKEMKRDLDVISTTWGSKVAISSMALTRPFQISSKCKHR